MYMYVYCIYILTFKSSKITKFQNLDLGFSSTIDMVIEQILNE